MRLSIKLRDIEKRGTNILYLVGDISNRSEGIAQKYEANIDIVHIDSTIDRLICLLKGYGINRKAKGFCWKWERNYFKMYNNLIKTVNCN